MGDYGELIRFFDRLRAKTGSEEMAAQVDALESCVRRIHGGSMAARAKVAQLTVELHEARHDIADARAAAEKAWLDGREQGYSDGFAECARLMGDGSRRVRKAR